MLDRADRVELHGFPRLQATAGPGTAVYPSVRARSAAFHERPSVTAARSAPDLRVGAGLTQIGEFSFILVQVARTAGQVGDEVYSATLAASLLTILINALLVRYLPAWLGTA